MTRFIHQETGLAFWRLALSDDRRSKRLLRGHCHFKASGFHKRTCIAQFGTCERFDATCTCRTRYCVFFLQLSITEFLSFGDRVPFTSSDVAIIAPYLPNSQLSLSLEHSICVNFQLGPQEHRHLRCSHNALALTVNLHPSGISAMHPRTQIPPAAVMIQSCVSTGQAPPLPVRS